MKQVLAVRKDISLTQGQLAQIISWTSIFSARLAEKNKPDLFKLWLRSSQKKVTIRLESLDELLKLQKQIENAHQIIVVPVVVPPNVWKNLSSEEPLALGIGPDHEHILDPLTRQFKLF